MGSGMIKIIDSHFNNCGTGVKSDIPVQFKGGTITNGGIGLDLTGDAARRSSVEGARFENLRVAIKNGSILKDIPELSNLDRMNSSQKENAILEIAATQPNLREEVVKNGPIGQFLRRQGIGDWVALSTLIAQGISAFKG